MARLVLAGRTHRDIGAQLYISPKTVDNHLQNVYGKLGVTDRSAAVAEAIRRGLLQ